jgi:group I intron endonuclease
MYQIYKITNQKNGMVYIGSSIEVERRWRQHKEASINEKDHHYNYPLMIAFREFGIANFTFEIIDTLPDH